MNEIPYKETVKPEISIRAWVIRYITLFLCLSIISSLPSILIDVIQGWFMLSWWGFILLSGFIHTLGIILCITLILLPGLIVVAKPHEWAPILWIAIFLLFPSVAVNFVNFLRLRDNYSWMPFLVVFLIRLGPILQTGYITYRIGFFQKSRPLFRLLWLWLFCGTAIWLAPNIYFAISGLHLGLRIWNAFALLYLKLGLN